jgi:antitoxin MazE
MDFHQSMQYIHCRNIGGSFVRAQVTKWGNSLALRIPGAYAKQIGVEEGRPVDIDVADGKLVVTPVSDQPAYDIGELVARMKGAARADEIDTGEPRGDEAW